MIDEEWAVDHFYFLSGEQTNRRAPSAKTRLTAGVLGQHADHFQRNHGPAPRIVAAIVRVLLGNFLQFLGKTKGIHGTHILIECHLRMLGVTGAQLPDHKVAKDHQLIGRSQFRSAPVQFGLAVIGTKRGSAGEHRGAVAFFCTDAGHLICGHVFNHDSDFFPFDHHGLVVGTDAAALEPSVAKNLVKDRHELAEVGGAFDGCTREAEIFRHFVVMDRQVTVVFLVAQHLSWPAKFSNQHPSFSHRFAPPSISDLATEKN